MRKSNRKTYNIGNQVLLNLEAVLTVELDDLGADSSLARNNSYLQKKIAEKLDELFEESSEFNSVAYKIKIINKSTSSYELVETTEDTETE